LSAEKSMRDYLKDKYAPLVKTMEDKKDLLRRRGKGAQGGHRRLEEKWKFLKTGDRPRFSRAVLLHCERTPMKNVVCPPF